jgi:hypothetical protein
VPLLVLETQVSAIPLIKVHIKSQDRYVEIASNGNVAISFAESCALLEPVDSDDRVSWLLHDGCVFTSNLTPPRWAERTTPPP